MKERTRELLSPVDNDLSIISKFDGTNKYGVMQIYSLNISGPISEHKVYKEDYVDVFLCPLSDQYQAIEFCLVDDIEYALLNGALYKVLHNQVAGLIDLLPTKQSPTDPVTSTTPANLESFHCSEKV